MTAQRLNRSRDYAIATTLFVFFVSLLGRFDLDRLSLEPLPGLSLRSLLSLVGCLILLPWWLNLPSDSHRIGRPRGLLVRLAIFVLFLYVSMAWSPAPDWETAGDMTITWLLVLLTASAFSAHGAVCLRLWPSLLAITGSAYALLGLATLGTAQRLAVLGGGPNVFGRVTGLGAVALLFLMWQRHLSWWFSPLVAVCLLATVASGSRGATVAVFLACAMLLLTIVAVSRHRARSIVLVLVGLVLVGWAAWSSLGSIIDERFIALTVETQYTSGRNDLFALAILLFKRDPLLGGGTGSFGLAFGDPTFYAHNLFLQSLAELGIVGSLLLAATLFPAAFTLVRRWAHHPYCVLFLSCSFLMFAASMVSGTYFDARLLWIFLAGGLAAHALHDAEPRAVEPDTTDLAATQMPRPARTRS